MAYTTANSTKRTIYSGSSRGNLQHEKPTYSQQQPSYSHAQEHHVYEEQPHYSNEQTISRQSIGGDNRRSGGVCNIFIFNKHRIFNY
jgi:hypothetical protein